MQLFDGCVIPYPSGTVSISRYARELRSLGFSGCVVNGRVPQTAEYDIQILSARYLIDIPARILAREADKPAGMNEVVYVRAGDAGFCRTAIQTPGVHVLMDIETAPKDAFDRYCAHLAAEKGVGIGLSTLPLIQLRDVSRQKVIRRYEEIFTLQNRYEFPLVVSSHASDITHLKSPREMIRLFSLVCEDEDLLYSSMTSVGQIKNRQGPVREVR